MLVARVLFAVFLFSLRWVARAGLGDGACEAHEMFCRGMAGPLERQAHEARGGVVCVWAASWAIRMGWDWDTQKSGRRTDGGGCSCQRKCQVALPPWRQQHGTIHEQDFMSEFVAVVADVNYCFRWRIYFAALGFSSKAWKVGGCHTRDLTTTT